MMSPAVSEHSAAGYQSTFRFWIHESRPARTFSDIGLWKKYAVILWRYHQDDDEMMMVMMTMMVVIVMTMTMMLMMPMIT